jgi:hypothetical protein
MPNTIAVTGSVASPFVRREHRPNDAGRGNDDRVVAAGKRLRDRQHDGIAARQFIVMKDVLDWLGNSRHSRAPGQARVLAAIALNRHCSRCRAALIRASPNRPFPRERESSAGARAYARTENEETIVFSAER